MKSKKRIVRITLFIIIFMILIASMKASHGVAVLGAIGALAGGATLAVAMSEVLQLAVMAISGALNLVIDAVTGLSRR